MSHTNSVTSGNSGLPVGATVEAVDINAGFSSIFLLLQNAGDAIDSIILDATTGAQQASDREVQIGNAFQKLENATTNPSVSTDPNYNLDVEIFGANPINNSVWQLEQPGADAGKWGPMYTNENTQEQSIIKVQDGTQQIWSSANTQFNQAKQAPIGIGSALAQYESSASRFFG